MKKIRKIIKFKVGDIVIYQRKKYIVSGTRGWVHRNGWISLCRAIGEVSLLTRIEEVKLFKRRELITKNFWKIFPEGEK